MKQKPLSMKRLLEHGKVMLHKGWKVEPNPKDMTGKAGYTWISPRGETYSSAFVNAPSEEAVNDATSHDDYPCTIIAGE